jgi:tetratricopeptide (TPR) repeat protein
VLGCINTPDNDIKVGQPIYTEDLKPQEYIEKLLRGHLTAQDWEFALAEARTAEARGNGDFDNAVAVALLHLGKTKRAVKILEKLERRKPGSYYVAANLGTAYELLGNNEKAYEWIAKSMKRNPDSHFGTEWLHLKILKAKLAIAKDPKWIDTSSVLGINWESIGNDLAKVQVKSDEGVVHNADAVRKALEYQLHERTEFVKPTDPTVASLLYDLSHLVRHSRSTEHGDLVLAAAHTYGYPRTPISITAVPGLAIEVRPAVVQTSYWIPAGIAVGILTLLGFATFWLFRRRATKMQ